MNFLFRRRFLQNVGFQLQQRPAPNLYPLSTLSLSYFLSFYPFSLLLLRLTMTHDACVWIIQNPPINNKKKPPIINYFNMSVFATEPVTPKPSRNFPPPRHIQQYGFHCFLLLFPVFVTFVWFRFDSCMCCFRLLFFQTRYNFCLQYDDRPLLSLIRWTKHPETFRLSLSLLFSVPLTNHYVFFSCVIRLCFRSLFSTLNTYKLEHTLPLFGRYTNQQTSTHSHKSVFKNGPPTVQDAALVLRADAEARPGQVRWNKWSAEGIIHCFSSNSFFLSLFYTHSVKLLNHVLFFLCTCVFFANIFLNTFYLLRSLLRVTFCSN